MIYRTGDLGYYEKSGIVQFISRIDSQVKIRGYRIEIKETRTCGQLIDYLKEKYNIEVDMLAADGETIITTFLESGKAKRKLKLEEAYELNTKKKIQKNYLNIQVIGSIDEAKIGDETLKNVSVFLPPIKYIFK